MGEGKILEILDPSTIAFLLLAGFIAAFIDSTVGGGGLISTPALLALGLPVNFALGTNKLAASMGGLMSVFSFWRAGKINQKVAISLMPLSFLGSALGAYVVYLLPEQLMKNVIVVLLVAVAVYTYRRKDWGDVSAVTAAVNAAVEQAIKKPASYAVIANPHEEIVKLVELSASRWKKRQQENPEEALESKNSSKK